jgi:hypothetical protein
MMVPRQLAKTTEDIRVVDRTLTVGAVVAMVMPDSLAVHSSGEEDFPVEAMQAPCRPRPAIPPGGPVSGDPLPRPPASRRHIGETNP